MLKKKHVVISLEHPAWVHQFKGVIQNLKEEGHAVTVFAIKKDITIYLLEKFSIPYILVATNTGKGFFQKAWLLISITFKIWHSLLEKKPDIFIGRASPMMALNAFLFRRPHIVYEDTERSFVSLAICKLFSSKIVTNKSFLRNLGKKHLLVDTHKELFYLHPDELVLNNSVLEAYGLTPKDTFSIVRFVAWNADHDMGHQGIPDELKIRAVREFEKYGRVLVTSEVPVPAELEAYLIKVAPEHIHSLMYHASLVFGESATMASEAAMLGVHSVFCYFAQIGTTSDIEKNYNLLFNFGLSETEISKAIDKGIELLKDKEIKLKGKSKLNSLYHSKVNGTKIFLEQLKPFL